MVLVGSTVVVSKIVGQDVEPFLATALRMVLSTGLTTVGVMAAAMSPESGPPSGGRMQGIALLLYALFLREAIHAWQWVGFGCVVVAIAVAFREGDTSKGSGRLASGEVLDQNGR